MTRTQAMKEKVFSKKEIEYCESHKLSEQNYAGRYAAKEAFFKALGTGWRDGMAFKEVEVVNDELGNPRLILHGKSKLIAEEKGIVKTELSISHLKDIAAAVVTLETAI